ncbi:hypothetical protein RND71_005489 [Anisodus tanguticus]|uniref:FBD domain-containing protein n=1 Tax=Anisodus tanguticus TaxID=243964 RepID=A0AAE1VMQ8_9SOLA|nr:hypothetical protein RND71_005489 [Anisodus tanguticus]
MEGVLAVRMELMDIKIFYLDLLIGTYPHRYRTIWVLGDYCYMMPPKGRKRSQSLTPECYDKPEDFDFAKVFESCSALKHLLYDLSNIKIFAEEGYEVPTRLPFDLNNVKRFYVSEIMVMESYNLSYALCLIRSFPYLEYLEIEVYSEEDYSCILESLELEHFSDVTFNHLREVKLECFAVTTSELQLIKLLLAKSPVLVRMLIDRQFLDGASLDTRLEVCARTAKVGRITGTKFEMQLSKLLLARSPMLVRMLIEPY